MWAGAVYTEGYYSFYVVLRNKMNSGGFEKGTQRPCSESKGEKKPQIRNGLYLYASVYKKAEKVQFNATS